jgi:acetaldehyde dehydrogenase
VVPGVNLDRHLGAANVNMVTCGGQATIPVVAAISRVVPVVYAEIVAAIASKSAGPGTRANIDEFTATTARAIEAIGGARRGKANIVLNPAEPPLTMRDTVLCLCEEADPEAIRASVRDMVGEVQRYVPGYRLKHEVQIERIPANDPLVLADHGIRFSGLKVVVFLEVEGAAHYLPVLCGQSRHHDFGGAAHRRISGSWRMRRAGHDAKVYLQDVTLRDGMHATPPSADT